METASVRGLAVFRMMAINSGCAATWVCDERYGFGHGVGIAAPIDVVGGDRDAF